jgi:hypothetical protein
LPTAKAEVGWISSKPLRALSEPRTLAGDPLSEAGGILCEHKMARSLIGPLADVRAMKIFSLEKFFVLLFQPDIFFNVADVAPYKKKVGFEIKMRRAKNNFCFGKKF